MVFIVVNHAVKVLSQICLLLMAAINIVLDPNQYIGNTIFIIGFGDVKVNTQDPITVKKTGTSSNQNDVLSER